MMMLNAARFNTFLIMVFTLWFAAGCQTDPASAQKKKESKEASTLEIYVQINPNSGGTEKFQHITLLRSAPMSLDVSTEPAVDSGNIEKAEVVEDFGAVAIKLTFNTHGQLMLDQVTAKNRGKRLAMFAKFDKEVRWLAAPVITKEIANGVLIFSPDASREETERIVRGLNNLIKKANKNDSF